MLEPDRALIMRIGIDRDVLRRLLTRDPPDRETEAIVRLADQVAAVCVLPVVSEEIAAEGSGPELRWRDAGLVEIQPDEFLMGCATGMARRYLDYYPDPRDCRLVAEAECAKLDALVTLNGDLVRGLGTRAENIRIETPFDTFRRARALSKR